MSFPRKRESRVIISLLVRKKDLSFWRKAENEDEPMGACSQSVAYRSPEVCRSVAEESISNELYKSYCYKMDSG